MLDEAGRRAVVDKFLKSLEQIGSQFNGSIKTFIASELTDSELAALFGQIDFFQELTDMGYLEEVEKYMKEHEKVIEDIIIKARQRGVDITGNNIQQLESVMLADEQFLLRRAETFGFEFKSAILKPLIAGVPRRTIINELLPQIQAQVPFRPNWLDTAINQAFTAFDNVSTQQAFKEEPGQRFVLVHPQDANTRRLCNHAIAIQRENPEGFTIEEINSGKLNEGFIPKSKSEPQVYTFENLGGFNCRGWWVLADEAPAKRAPKKTKTEPKKGGFVEAKTINEAEQWAKENIIQSKSYSFGIEAKNNADYKHLTISEANLVNRKLNELKAEYGVSFNNIRTTDETGYNIPHAYITGGRDNADLTVNIQVIKEELKNTYRNKQTSVDMLNNFLVTAKEQGNKEDIRYYKDLLKQLENKPEYYASIQHAKTAEESIEIVLNHEYTHALQHQSRYLDSPVRAEIANYYSSIKSDPVKFAEYGYTEYAMTNWEEFWAEAFALNKMGKLKDDNMIKLMQRISRAK